MAGGPLTGTARFISRHLSIHEAHGFAGASPAAAYPRNQRGEFRAGEEVNPYG